MAITLTKEDKEVPPLGMMTAADRETWAAVWNRLISVSPKNKEYLNKLCSAMFLVCLDDKACGVLLPFLIALGPYESGGNRKGHASLRWA